MSKIEKFEDLIAWQKARKFTASVYKITSDSKFSKDYGLTDQLRRTTVSIMANIAEGFERRSRPDFHRFLLIAKASCAEARSHLYVSFDCKYINETIFQILLSDAEELGRIIGGLRVSVMRNAR